MKLLIISPYPVFPGSAGGKIRIVQLARNLADLGLAVSILTPFHFTQRHRLYCGERFALYQVKYPFLVPFLFTDRPFPYGYLISFHPGLAFLLRRLFQAHDIYQFEHPHLAALVDRIPENKIITYDAHNVEHDYIRSECGARWVESVSGRRLYRLEKKIGQTASHIFTCSRNDKDRFNELYGISPLKISVAPNGIRPPPAFSETAEPAMFQKHPRLRQFPRRAIYSGSNVVHNRAAVRFILECLAPALAQEYAFIINGTCGTRFRRLSRDNVFFDPGFDNFADYAAPDTVGLNPAIQGSGTNLKVLHYLSHGMPVVSTPFGMRGYDDLMPFVTVRPYDRFVDALRASEHPPRPNPAELQQRYGWRRVADQMMRVYRELLIENANSS
ncbi:MAG: glycosyltransferase [Candidatus Binatia bacterium]